MEHCRERRCCWEHWPPRPRCFWSSPCRAQSPAQRKTMIPVEMDELLGAQLPCGEGDLHFAGIFTSLFTTISRICKDGVSTGSFMGVGNFQRASCFRPSCAQDQIYLCFQVFRRTGDLRFCCGSVTLFVMNVKGIT